MIAALATDRRVFRRLYTLRGGMMWRAEVRASTGGWRWLVSWYGVSEGHARYVFGGDGEADTLRGAWCQVRHCRTYSGGGDILCMNGKVGQ